MGELDMGQPYEFMHEEDEQSPKVAPMREGTDDTHAVKDFYASPATEGLDRFEEQAKENLLQLVEAVQGVESEHMRAAKALSHLSILRLDYRAAKARQRREAQIEAYRELQGRPRRGHRGRDTKA